jgi:hypothetical protein
LFLAGNLTGSIHGKLHDKPTAYESTLLYTNVVGAAGLRGRYKTAPSVAAIEEGSSSIGHTNKPFPNRRREIGDRAQELHPETVVGQSFQACSNRSVVNAAAVGCGCNAQEEASKRNQEDRSAHTNRKRNGPNAGLAYPGQVWSSPVHSEEDSSLAVGRGQAICLA